MKQTIRKLLRTVTKVSLRKDISPTTKQLAKLAIKNLKRLLKESNESI